jgi:hypothetical protein
VWIAVDCKHVFTYFSHGFFSNLNRILKVPLCSTVIYVLFSVDGDIAHSIPFLHPFTNRFLFVLDSVAS